MHFQYVRPGGIWGLFTLLTSAAVQLIDQQLFKAINGDDGGTWAPASVITLGGAGVHVTGPLVADHLSGHVTLGNWLTIDVDAVLDLHGEMRVVAGAFVDVEGQPFNPGKILINESAVIALMSPVTPGAPGGSFFAFPGTLIDLMGNVVLESGSAWFMQGGALGLVGPGALVNVAGFDPSNMASVAFWQYSQAVFANGARAIFANADLLMGAGTTLQVANVLHFIPGSIITGGTTISDGTLIVLASSSPAHPVTVAFGHNATLDFAGGSSITGYAVFEGAARFDQGAELNCDVSVDTGYTLKLDAATVRTGPEDRSGPGAVTGERKTTGPDWWWTIDAEAWDWVVIPPQSMANRVWVLATPQNPNRAITITLTAGVSPLNNDLFIAQEGSTAPLARFINDSTRQPGSVTFGWDPDDHLWRVKSSTTTSIVGGAGTALKIPA